MDVLFFLWTFIFLGKDKNILRMILYIIMQSNSRNEYGCNLLKYKKKKNIKNKKLK